MGPDVTADPNPQLFAAELGCSNRDRIPGCLVAASSRRIT